jgi:hypothetical protein
VDVSAESGEAPREANGPASAARLRIDIDSGRTGDKNPAGDPAAVPLGTDDEAAGTPVDLVRGEMALRQEVPAAATSTTSPPRGPAEAGRRGPPYATIVLVAVIVLAALAFIFVR